MRSILGRRVPGPGDRIAAGRVSATLLEDGARLRDVAAGGESVLRGVGFVVRDSVWGTYGLSGALAGPVEVVREGGATRIAAAGRLETAEGDLDWAVRTRLAEAEVTMEARFSSGSGFTTNRTGLVVLHALGGARGRRVRVRHPDGSVEEGGFPELVSPHQPFLDVSGLETSTAGGLPVSIGFEGEVFECEDQRNWTDASYKTYCRPLRLGHPYRIGAGEQCVQRVTIRFGEGGFEAARGGAPAVRARARLAIEVRDAWPAAGPFAAVNRQSPAPGVWAWSSTPTVHADDDDTIGETIEPLPDLVATAVTRAPGCRLRIAPIRLREGGAPDERRGSLIEAAWVLGTIAGYLDPAVERLGFETPVGATAHVLAALRDIPESVAALAWPGQGRVRGLLIEGGGKRTLLVAHVAAGQAAVVLPEGGWTGCERLEESGFRAVAPPGGVLRASGFAVYRLTG